MSHKWTLCNVYWQDFEWPLFKFDKEKKVMKKRPVELQYKGLTPKAKTTGFANTPLQPTASFGSYSKVFRMKFSMHTSDLASKLKSNNEFSCYYWSLTEWKRGTPAHLKFENRKIEDQK